MNLGFLAPVADGDAVARSSMEGMARAAGAQFEVRDGWSVAARFPGTGSGDAPVGWADVSYLRKIELQASAEDLDATGRLRLGEAVRHEGAWWCRLSSTRALVIGGDGALDGGAVGAGSPDAGSGGGAFARALDVSCNFGALTIVGPLARETFARFCALDLRPDQTPVRALRPGSIGRQPGVLIREDEERYLFVFGAATGEYMWSIVADAGEHLGGRPIGVDELAPVPEEVATNA